MERVAPAAAPRAGRDTVPAACAIVFAATWVALAISPASRATWLLENLLTFAIVPALVATYRTRRFTDRAYVQGTIFLVLHTVGSHYTYSDVPIGEWVSEALSLGRNHYDRVVHLAAGLLLLVPARELAFHRAPRLSPGREVAFTVFLLGFASLSYELLEWAAAVIVDPDAGTAFLGTQGDPWDCQADMALACLGALLAGAFELVRGARGRA